MAEFEAKVYRLTIEPHPNADLLELARVGDYRSVVGKGDFKTGDLGVYIPEAAVCPDWVIRKLGLEGKLAGKDKNRVKAIKLRQVLSQGLIYPIETTEARIHMLHYNAGEDGTGEGIRENFYCPNAAISVNEGDVVTEKLGLVKWEPPIPTHMAGEVENAFGCTLRYDIENFKKYPDVIEEGEPVVMTEKIHGTWCCLGYHPDVTHPLVTSKGLSDRGLIFKLNERNKDNLYVRALHGTEVQYEHDGTTEKDDVVTMARRLNVFGELTPFYILGEVFGQGVQDLHYGMNVNQDAPPFRVFDIYVGQPGQGRYLNHDEMVGACINLGLVVVPTLHWGAFTKEAMLAHTDGRECVSGNASNIREGVVIKPLVEREDPMLGRVVLKSVSERYLLRKGNATEFN